MTTTFTICAAVTSVSALVSLGFSGAALRTPGAATRTAALYTLARSVALAVVSLLAFAIRKTDWLEATACAMIVVQAADGLVGLRTGSVVKTVGPVMTAALNAAALYALMRS